MPYLSGAPRRDISLRSAAPGLRLAEHREPGEGKCAAALREIYGLLIQNEEIVIDRLA